MSDRKVSELGINLLVSFNKYVKRGRGVLPPTIRGCGEGQKTCANPLIEKCVDVA